jgi:UDP-2,3-diacylglucosamine hydrolase
MKSPPSIPPPPAPIGLIAGAGQLPLLVARGLREQGRPVHAIGFAGQYEEALPKLCDRFHPVGLFRLGQWARRLRAMEVQQAIMVGGVDKAKLMHDPLRLIRRIPDGRTLLVWRRKLRHDHRSPAILSALADELARCGVTLIDSTTSIQEHLASPGVMTRKEPTALQRADIDFAWEILLASAKLGVGQAIAVREKDVIAVEASEGTAAMIRRAGELCSRRCWTLLKGAGPEHDRRSDVPTIGCDTIRALSEAGAGCLALEAGGVIMLDKEHTIALADQLGVAMIGV